MFVLDLMPRMDIGAWRKENIREPSFLEQTRKLGIGFGESKIHFRAGSGCLWGVFLS